MTKDEQIYLVKFMNFPVKRMVVRNHYEITKELQKLIEMCKSSPEWIVREI